jgi:hypothetical protein
MSTTTSNSKTTTATTTPNPLTWAQRFDELVCTNTGSVPVWVATDGIPAVAGAAGMLVILPGAVAVFANRSLKPDITSPSWPGSTAVSLVTASGSADVVVAPQ